MKILVACEYSGTVRDAFIAKGHDAISCDLLPTDRPGPHYQGEVEDILEEQWDMLIGFPPCTYLCSSGIHWNAKRPERAQLTHEAVLFFLSLIDANIPKIAIENPIGVMSTNYRKPDQIIQPYNFGHDASKSTCLWLKGLPLLRPTKYVSPRLFCKECKSEIDPQAGSLRCANCGSAKYRQIWGNQTPGGQNKLGPSEDRWKQRSLTYQGIADAMAGQWG